MLNECGMMATAQSDRDSAGGDVTAQLRRVLADVLSLEPAVAAALCDDSGLFGHLPELDSMAVAGLLTEIEDRFGIIIDDDEIDGELFATFGSLAGFVRAKVVA
jgi:acyl carrier protein